MHWKRDRKRLDSSVRNARDSIRFLMYRNLHECAYPGSIKYGIAACQNLITENKIFCKRCFQIVTPEARRKWQDAFPYDVPYDVAVKPSNQDQREAILTFVQCITFAKRQLSLFGGKDRMAE